MQIKIGFKTTVALMILLFKLERKTIHMHMLRGLNASIIRIELIKTVL